MEYDLSMSGRRMRMKNCGEDGSSYRWDRPIILDCRLFHELRLKYVEKWKMKSSAEEI